MLTLANFQTMIFSMEQLFLLRHGIAARSLANQTDFEIPLTQEGIQLLLAETLGMKQLQVSPDLILSSPFHRARQTAEIVANELNPSLKSSIEIIEELVPYGNPPKLMSILEEYRHFKSILLVSHQPLMGSVAGYLTQGAQYHLPFEKGSLGCLEIDETPTMGEEELCWLFTPQELIEKGKPH